MKPSNDISVHALQISDLEKLSELGKETFRQTYYGLFTEHDLDILFGIEQLLTEYQDSNNSFLIAKQQNNLIGYAKITYQDNHIAYLGKLYLLQNAQGFGIGKLLLKSACQQIIQQKKTKIKLNVWEENQKAIDYYLKHGFIQSEKSPFDFNGKIFYDYQMEHDVAALFEILT